MAEPGKYNIEIFDSEELHTALGITPEKLKYCERVLDYAMGKQTSIAHGLQLIAEGSFSSHELAYMCFAYGVQAENARNSKKDINDEN